VESLLTDLKRSGVHLIARIPAFTDQRACLSNTSLGLPLASGALWADDNNCYWMDPGDPDVLLYITNICIELQDLGFREVVLDDFFFPETDSIVYDETERSKAEVLTSAAETLIADMETLEIRLSFGYHADEAFPVLLPSGRLYFSIEDGALVGGTADTHKASVVTPATQFVFISESRDTRFDEYGHLTPAFESAIVDE
ncbi:MAG: hypothetical protein IIY16_03910, partial [Oscillospiraceae bacterium]|nr:hypothetical protein [Oscillospiraceae bacterium]